MVMHIHGVCCEHARMPDCNMGLNSEARGWAGGCVEELLSGELEGKAHCCASACRDVIGVSARVEMPFG